MAGASTIDPPSYPPDYLSTLSTRELQEIFRSARTLPLATLLNRGAVSLDQATGRIWRDSYWKGSFAKDTPMGLEERLLTGAGRMQPAFAGGRFWKRFDAIEGQAATAYIVNYGVSSLPGRASVRQVAYPDERRPYIRGGDDVLLLTYRNQPYRIVYDLIKVIDDRNCIGVMHLGRFPRGVKFATFVMSRNNYPFHKMAIPDHEALFAGDSSRVPGVADLTGAWKGYIVFLRHPEVALHNQFNPPLLRVRFRAVGGGVAASIGYGPFTSARRLEFDAHALRLTASSSSDDEIRMLDADTLIGRRVRAAAGGIQPVLRYVLRRVGIEGAAV